MELWKMPTLGITSEDFLATQGNNEIRAFYGSLWRFADDKRVASRHAPQQQESNDRFNTRTVLNNELVDEARKQGHPIPQPDSAHTGQQLVDQGLADQQKANNAKALRGMGEDSGNVGKDTTAIDNFPAVEEESFSLSEDQLKGMTLSELKEVGSAIGLANLELPKKKLIEHILEKQD